MTMSKDTERASGWIPEAARRPERGVRVLARCCPDSSPVYYTVAEWDKLDKYVTPGFGLAGEGWLTVHAVSYPVTHWMPIPLLPDPEVPDRERQAIAAWARRGAECFASAAEKLTACRDCKWYDRRTVTFPVADETAGDPIPPASWCMAPPVVGRVFDCVAGSYGPGLPHECKYVNPDGHCKYCEPKEQPCP